MPELDDNFESQCFRHLVCLPFDFLLISFWPYCVTYVLDLYFQQNYHVSISSGFADISPRISGIEGI
jgi:hypothetical protein